MRCCFAIEFLLVVVLALSGSSELRAETVDVPETVDVSGTIDASGSDTTHSDTTAQQGSTQFEEYYAPIHYVYSTRPVPAWDLRGSFGVDITLLPRPITEYATPAPSLDLRARLGLPLNVQAYGRAASNIATSFVQAGLCWSYVFENFSFGFGWSAAYMYGNLTFVDGFNTSQHRWTNYPMLTAAAKFNHAVFTARIEAELMTSLERRIETQVSKADNDIYNGTSFTVAVEQPFWKNTHILLGTTLSFSSNPYQSWFLYNTFRDRLLSTEFFMGFLL